MDQAFNDLVAYEDTIENYIKVGKDLQKNKEILVYLVYFPHLPKGPHSYTKQSTFISLYHIVITLGKKEGLEGGDFNIGKKSRAPAIDTVLNTICEGLPVSFVL